MKLEDVVMIAGMIPVIVIFTICFIGGFLWRE